MKHKLSINKNELIFRRRLECEKGCVEKQFIVNVNMRSSEAKKSFKE